MSRELIVNRQLNPLLESLPGWVESYRPHQVRAVLEAVDAFSRVNVVVIDAPTGSGKTLIAETVRRMVKASALYVCSTKSLQDQFLRDFDYAKVIKGRSNYPTERFPEKFDAEWYDRLTAEDCNWTRDGGCSWCSSKSRCPYECAKGDALNSPLAVLNTSYMLAECNSVGRFSGRGLVIADEADTLESELMGYVSVDISERRMEKFGWFPPAKVTVKESWKEWIDEKLPDLRKWVSRVPDSHDVRGMREHKYLVGLLEKLLLVRSGLEDDDSPWVYTGKGNEGSGRIKDGNKGRAVSFKPARVDALGKTMLWRHGGKWLLMSATVISAQEMLDSLGYTDSFEVVTVASTFPKENRLVKYRPIANMGNKNRELAQPLVVEECVRIAATHPTDRILIHSVSYQLTDAIYQRLMREVVGRRKVFTYKNAQERAKALGMYLSYPGSILVAPSMDRGIDLPGDACRVQIIAKVPFPNLGDRQISARLHSRNGEPWYRIQTIRTLVQMTGRAVRSSSDFAVTYVLDKAFEDQLWFKSRNLIPKWWAEAVVWPERKR